MPCQETMRRNVPRRYESHAALSDNMIHEDTSVNTPGKLCQEKTLFLKHTTHAVPRRYAVLWRSSCRDERRSITRRWPNPRRDRRCKRRPMHRKNLSHPENAQMLKIILQCGIFQFRFNACHSIRPKLLTKSKIYEIRKIYLGVCLFEKYLKWSFKIYITLIIG